MSYDIYLKDPVTKEVIEFDEKHEMRGGMYAIGGTKEAWLNITYNYSNWYYKDYAFGEKGIRTIYGMSGAESIPVLKKVIQSLENTNEDLSEEEIKELKDQGVNGYWLPTKENAIKPLYQLLAMAQLRPDGIWEGD